MRIKKVYDTEADVPADYLTLYEERDGKWHLTVEVEGTSDSGDVARLNSALTKERNDHRATKEKLRGFGDLDPERTRQVMDRVGDLGDWEEVEKKLHRLDGPPPQGEDQIQARIDAEIQRRERTIKAPLERQITQLTEARTEAERERDEAKGTLRGRTIADELRGAATKTKVISSALDDVLMYGDRLFEINESGEVVTRDGVGVTPGLKPEAWLSDMQERRPHWWPQSEGAGSRGNRGGPIANNPFAADTWDVTAQGRLVQEKGQEAAERMAKAAGTTLGGPKPAQRSRAA